MRNLAAAMSNIAAVIFAATVLAALTACQSISNTSSMVAPTPAGTELKSEKVRQVVEAPPGDLAQLVAGNNAFALDLYRALGQTNLPEQPSGNLFYSPYSLSSALAMTYAGARGATAQQMAQVLRFQLPADRLHPAFNSLDTQLAKRGQGAQGKDGKGFRLRNVNALWGQNGYTFLPAFLDTLAQNYGAGLRLLDFQKTEEARQTINAWVERQTEDRIKDLIALGALDAATRLVLTNAIYFNAAWASPFEPAQTRDGPFNLADGSQVNVPMMHKTDTYSYAQGDGYQAVELPYDQRELSMLILLPSAGPLSAFEKSLDDKRVDGIVKSLQDKRLALSLPKWQFEASFQLAETLSKLGMRDAFMTGAADFSGMDGTRNLYIGQVIHKAFVAVDETGTEAAAATAVILPASGIAEAPLVVTIDRPFIFLIRDNATGAILFVGRVMKPG